MKACFTLLILYHLVDLTTTNGRAQADFSSNGVKGHVRISEVNEDIEIVFRLQKDLNVNVYIKKFPVNWELKDRCTDEALGTTIGDLNILTTGTKNARYTFIKDNLSLRGPNNIIGRSLLIIQQQTKKRSCATIRMATENSAGNLTHPVEISTAMVRLFSKSIGGTIFFLEAGPDVSVLTDLYFNDGTTSDASDFDWFIRSGKTTAACMGPRNVMRNGDLTTTHGNISVSAKVHGARKFFTNTDLSIDDIVGNSIEVSLGSKKGCGVIKILKKRVARAIFNMDGVKGEMTFEQNSPFDPVFVARSFSNLRSLANAYHVHEFPVPARLTKDDYVCSGAYLAGHFNPFSVASSSSPAAGQGTDDQYQMGDLSGKYGTFADLDDVAADPVIDLNLQLFFGQSIIGRSIVIHKKDKGARWVCGNINYPYETVRTAVATFRFPVIGQVWFRQDEDDPTGDTTVFASLGHHGSSSSATTNHKFDVHVSPVGADMMAATGRCQSVGERYNPVTVYDQGSYSNECGPSSQERCQLGDLSMKSGGGLNIGDAKRKWKHKFYTDVNLPLSGTYSIIGRSVTIRAENQGSAIIACANIIPYNPKFAVVSEWTSVIGGKITFVQESPFDLTQVHVDLEKLGSLAGPYHVHVRSLPPGVASPCSGGSVGGHYNPYSLDKTGGPAEGVGSLDQYELGDMSGKYGRLTGKQSVDKSLTDNNLPLQGQFSIIGRSVVVHKDVNGARWTCANIDLDTDMMMAGRTLHALANFNNGQVEGYINMWQYVFDDGSMSETGIELSIKYTENTTLKTQNHKWYVHENAVGDDGSSSSSPKCASTGSLYNPFRADGSLTYSSDCSIANVLRCKLGDMSGKHGLKIEIGSGRHYITDMNLPLTGSNSVVGRSFVINEKDNADTKLACASIIQGQIVSGQVTTPSPAVEMKAAYAALLLIPVVVGVVLAVLFRAKIKTFCQKKKKESKSSQATTYVASEASDASTVL